MKFSSFEQQFARKAVLLILDAQSQERVYDWTLSTGFDLCKSFSGNLQNPEDFDFHVTVICSENERYIENGIKDIPPTTTTFIGFEILGKRDQITKGVPVLLVNKSEGMLKIRQLYEGFYQLYDNWPDWKAHMSLSYSWEGDPDLELLTIPNFPITFDRIKVSNLD